MNDRSLFRLLTCAVIFVLPLESAVRNAGAEQPREVCSDVKEINGRAVSISATLEGSKFALRVMALVRKGDAHIKYEDVTLVVYDEMGNRMRTDRQFPDMTVFIEGTGTTTATGYYTAERDGLQQPSKADLVMQGSTTKFNFPVK